MGHLIQSTGAPIDTHKDLFTCVTFQQGQDGRREKKQATTQDNFETDQVFHDNWIFIWLSQTRSDHPQQAQKDNEQAKPQLAAKQNWSLTISEK